MIDIAMEPLLGNSQPIPIPYHYPQTYDFRIGNSDGTSSEDHVFVIDTSKTTSTTVTFSIVGQINGSINIDWGDGTNGCLIPLGTAGIRRVGSYETRLEFTATSVFSVTHTYAKHGIYRIIIKDFFSLGVTVTRPIIQPITCLISIESIGKESKRINSFNYVGATNLIYVPPYLPSTITSLNGAFTNCINLNQPEIARWNVSGITSTRQMLQGAKTSFLNGDWNWDTRNVTDFFNMFYGTDGLRNINFSGWTINGTTTTMFGGGTVLDNCSLINWSGANTTNMFAATILNNCTLSGWKITSTTANMFNVGAVSPASVNNLYLPNWDLRGSTSAANMFYGVNGTKSGLNDWNVSGITNMSSMFQYSSDFMIADLSNWDISKVTNFNSFMLRGLGLNAGGNASIRIDNWKIPSGATLAAMFGDPSANKFVSLSGWSFGGNSSSRMFGTINYTPTLINLNCDLSSWNTSGINDMNRMFEGCSSLSIGDISQWDTSNVTNMSGMFSTCNNFDSSVSGWNTEKVTNMAFMFYDARNFLGNGLENWNTSNVTNMRSMFQMVVGRGPNANLSGWDTSKVTDMSNMFSSSNNIIHRFAGSGIDNWNVTGVTAVSSMFRSNAALNTTLQCNLSGWNLCNCTDMTGFMQQCNIGSGNYDILLNSWEASSTGNPIKPWATGINVHFGTAKYTAASSGARQRLVNYGWTITDGGFQA